ncbi:MAG TPA: hypothetical protein VHY76_10345, partial [Acetobacteraceae bacterium]|nr:hypothetical protein [Acetobacteraceae bacterium]
YAAYMMLDEPHGNKSTYGYSTAGWVAAPAAGRTIARIAPMLGMLPDIQDAPQINQTLYIPLQPSRSPATPREPVTASAPPAPAPRPALTVPVVPLAPARPAARDARHEAALPAPVPADAVAESLAAR